MSKYLIGMVIVLTVGLQASAASPKAKAGADQGNGQTRLEIKRFRFNARYKNSFERLVLEFKTFNKNRSTPQVTVSTNIASHEATIHVDNANLVGAIPEAAINDSYSSRSRYLGPVSVMTDSPSNGFSIRTALKDAASNVEAFWLQNPLRLVVDVSSNEAPTIANQGGQSGGDDASEMEVHKPSARKVAAQAKGARSNETFMCFPVASQVSMAVTFRTHKPNVRTPRIPVNSDAGNASDHDAVVCYPKSAQVMAAIVYEPSNPPAEQVAAAVTEQEDSNNIPTKPTQATTLMNTSPKAVTSTIPDRSPIVPKKDERMPTAAVPSNAHVVDSAAPADNSKASASAASRSTTPALLPPMR